VKNCLASKQFLVKSIGAVVTLFLMFSSFAPLVIAQSDQPWEFQFYRLNMPADAFFKSPEVHLHGWWIDGPPPKGLVPTLGTINKVEDQAGKFMENEGYIFLHMKGIVPADVEAFQWSTYNSTGGREITWTQYGTVKGGSYANVEATAWLMISGGPSSLGIWRVDTQILTKSGPKTLFNASFTFGKYLADVSLIGLPSNIGADLNLDGMPVGEVKGNASIALGWLPGHTITMQDINLGQSTSRYHPSQPELKVSGPGQFQFQYVLQHYLSIESPYPVNGSGWYDQGKTVVISASAKEASKDTRVVFRGWSGDYSSKDTQISVVMDAPKHISTQYVTQYLLTVVSPVGSPQGSGWYDASSVATFSVTSPATEGFMGMLGGKYLFDHWTGDSSAAKTSASIVMDGAKSVTAEWHTDYTMPYIIFGVAAVVIVVAVFLFVKRRGSNRQTRQ